VQNHGIDAGTTGGGIPNAAKFARNLIAPHTAKETIANARQYPIQSLMNVQARFLRCGSVFGK
jgi:hypothetical protein